MNCSIRSAPLSTLNASASRWSCLISCADTAGAGLAATGASLNTLKQARTSNSGNSEAATSLANLLHATMRPKHSVTTAGVAPRPPKTTGACLGIGTIFVRIRCLRARLV